MNIADVDFRERGFEKYMDRITGFNPSGRIVNLETLLTDFFMGYGLIPVSLYVTTSDAFILSVMLDEIDFYTIPQKILETYKDSSSEDLTEDIIVRRLYDDTEEILKIHPEIVDRYPNINILSFIKYFVQKVRGF